MWGEGGTTTGNEELCTRLRTQKSTTTAASTQTPLPVVLDAATGPTPVPPQKSYTEAAVQVSITTPALGGKEKGKAEVAQVPPPMPPSPLKQHKWEASTYRHSRKLTATSTNAGHACSTVEVQAWNYAEVD